MADSTMTDKYHSLLENISSLLRDFQVEEGDLDLPISQHLQSIENVISSYLVESSGTTNNTILKHPSHSREAESTSNIDVNSLGSNNLLSGALDISYSINEGIVSFRPDSTQWDNFPKILQAATNLGAEKLGVAKVVVPCVGPLDEQDCPGEPARSFRTRQLPNGTVQLETVDDSTFDGTPNQGNVGGLSSTAAVEVFERLVCAESGLQYARYRTDIDLRLEEDRKRLGLPSSPIHPLAGDNLTKTKASVPGLHWPYAYKANRAFGSPFAMHREDWDLLSVNYLYRGTKIWIVISPASMDHFEEQIRQLNKVSTSNRCSQFLRHQSLYVPTNILKALGVSYIVVRQNAGEALITFPRAYHQGFSVGSTLAEAVNYADDKWKTLDYAECNRSRCPEKFITHRMMELRAEDEEQWSAACEDAQGNERMEVDFTPEGQSNNQATAGPGFRETTRNLAASASAPAVSASDPEVNVIRSKSDRSQLIQPFKRKQGGSQETRITKRGAREVSRKEVSNHFNDILTAPAVNPWDVYSEFVQLGSDIKEGFDENRALLLTRLFYAIGSPDAFCQLRDACASVRNGALQFPRPSKNVLDTIRALDKLETTLHLTSIAKRYYLLSLCAIRDQLQGNYSQRPRRRNRSFVKCSESDTNPGRVASQALNTMMAEAYPELQPARAKAAQEDDEYAKKSNILRQRLAAGQRWSKLADAFAPGIIALVPTQGDHQLSNTDYEKLSGPAIQALVNMLKKYRRGFLEQVSSSISTFTSSFLQQDVPRQKFLFESTEKTCLRNERQDSSRFVELCRLEDSQTEGMNR